MDSLWTGISGLDSHQKALDNEANNIANVNTVGYKKSRVVFADQIYQNRIGKGSKITDTEKLYEQGDLKPTGVSHDMALNGEGFFTVADTRNNTGSPSIYYTRAGNFRRGENGTLQDANGDEIQGWAMNPVDKKNDVVSTNPKVSVFTDDYTKEVASKIIHANNNVETITAKTTDFENTVKSDSQTVFTGYGCKTKEAKTSDVEALESSYKTALNNYAKNPNGASSDSVSQTSYLDLPDKVSTHAISADGDQVYAYIDGAKISQVWDTDYGTTMRLFADKISSKVTGLKAYIADPSTNPAYKKNGSDSAPVEKGALRIESTIPGKTYKITGVGMVASGTTTQGTFGNLISAVKGKGLGALQSARNALAEAVSGNQEDVFTTAKDLGTLDGNKTYKYQVSIFDRALDREITIPATAVDIIGHTIIPPATTPPPGPTSVDDFVTSINDSKDLNPYVKAFNINGQLVVKTVDSDFDNTFNSSLSADSIPSNETGGNGKIIKFTFGDSNKPLPDGIKDFNFSWRFNGGPGTGMTGPITVQHPADINAIVDDLNKNTTFSSLYKASKNSNGDLVVSTLVAPKPPQNPDPTQYGVDLVDTKVNEYPIRANLDYSGREGAGGEFLEMNNNIDQTSSKHSLQLELDNLGISDNKFSDFAVDKTGLITLTQDGVKYAVGQIAIARFSNQRGLNAIGSNLLEANADSGDPLYSLNNNKSAQVEGEQLELSKADLGESLVNLMVFQRSFEANAKTITTSDQMLTTLINIKR